MKLDVLLSCMHQTDTSLISKTMIKGDAIIINQCETDDVAQIQTQFGVAKMFSTRSRGLTKSRNMAISLSDGDICLLCDDDEILVEGYERIVVDTYRSMPEADIIAFDLLNHECALDKKVQELKFPKIMKICSCQITFRRKPIVDNGIRFDELLGAGTGNGAEEELKFLSDCRRANLKIYYVPIVIAEIESNKSTWFSGFDELFFENRGATTRYILGFVLSSAYAVYYLIKKYKLYSSQITITKAFKAIFKGIFKNKIGKQAKSRKVK